MKKKDFFIIFLGIIIGCFLYSIKIELEFLNFVVTTGAFGAAIYAIYYQHQESKKAEGKFKRQIKLQKKAMKEQRIAGAWQVLANKASGNSGKKEAIEFLVSQGLSLRGIDMSEETHGGEVYLDGLFKGFKKDRRKIILMHAKFSGANLMEADFSGANLWGANFSGAYLGWADFSEADFGGANFSKACLGADFGVADFSGAYLGWADFSGAYLYEANFSGADLGVADFSKVKLFNDKAFIDCYCWFDNDLLPKPPPGYKFEFEERTDENNQPIYPKNKPDYRYIKLIKLK